MTWQYYASHAADYAAATISAPVEHHWQQFEQGLSVGNAVLDLGCGSGRDLVHFESIGLRAVGLDYSAPLLWHARRVCDASLILGDLRTLPFATGAFEGVWALASLLHVRRAEVLPTLQGVRRIIKVGGRFLATMKAGTGEEIDELGRFFAYFCEEEWRQLLTQADFQVRSLSIDHERRTTASGRTADVRWLYSVCRAS